MEKELFVESINQLQLTLNPDEAKKLTDFIMSNRITEP